jgi:predicted ribosome quality control (RQC) complex YloA/Tae2 family protein
LKTTEQIAREIIKGINEDREELNRFIDFVKTHVLALKIAFRCDRGTAWELLSIFLREFEKIGMYRRKYDERVDDVAKKIKAHSSSAPLNKRLKNIMEEAKKLKEELEEYHREMAKKRRKNKSE